jgi:heme A synthase
MVKAIASAGSREGGTAWSGRLRGLLDIRYLTLLSVVATYALIVLGATVRATDSGLACPDWPRCHGQFIPPLETSILIEYSHRLAAATVGLIIAAVAAVAWLWHRENRFVVTGASVAVVMLIVQVLVGGVTVNMELPDTIVALHLSIALILLAVLVTTAVGTVWRGRSSSSPPGDGLPRLPAVTTLATFALILIGSYVANAEAALVYPDWPLFDGKLVSAGGRLADLHYAHRVVAAVVGLLLVAMLWRARRREPAAVVAAVAFALILYVAEVFVGAGNIWFDLATEVRVAHLAIATAIWVALVFALAWGYAERRGLTEGNV